MSTLTCTIAPLPHWDALPEKEKVVPKSTRKKRSKNLWCWNKRSMKSKVKKKSNNYVFRLDHNWELTLQNQLWFISTERSDDITWKGFHLVSLCVGLHPATLKILLASEAHIVRIIAKTWSLVLKRLKFYKSDELLMNLQDSSSEDFTELVQFINNCQKYKMWCQELSVNLENRSLD